MQLSITMQVDAIVDENNLCRKIIVCMGSFSYIKYTCEYRYMCVFKLIISELF